MPALWRASSYLAREHANTSRTTACSLEYSTPKLDFNERTCLYIQQEIVRFSKKQEVLNLEQIKNIQLGFFINWLFWEAEPEAPARENRSDLKLDDSWNESAR